VIVPVVPTGYTVTVFVLLCLLLIYKEVLRALGRSGSRQWRFFINSSIGVLLMAYGAILLSRFLFLLR
jgi:uncharacterized membrane protein YdcZ (DUF606 family)